MRFNEHQCWNWPKRTGGGSAAEMFEILPRDWSLRPIFTQQWASVDWGGRTPTLPRQFQPWWAHALADSIWVFFSDYSRLSWSVGRKNWRSRGCCYGLGSSAWTEPLLENRYTSLKVNLVGYNILSPTIRVYIHSFSRCWLTSLRNQAKFRENSNSCSSSRSFNVIGR